MSHQANHLVYQPVHPTRESNHRVITPNQFYREEHPKPYAVFEQVSQIMDQIQNHERGLPVYPAEWFGGAICCVLATQDERIHQVRTLGGDSRYLRRLHLTEFAVLGALSGLFASAGGILLG
jgi:hypothetical protein